MRCIDPSSLRYKVAQFFLWVILGRRNTYISPYKHGALSVSGIFIYKRKLLIAKRAEFLDNPGKWHIPAGYMDLHTNECVLEALQREAYEEHKLKIDISKLDVDKPLIVTYKPNIDTFEQKKVSLMNLQYLYHLSDDEFASITISNEAPDFKFVTIAELKQMEVKGQLIRSFSHIYNLLS